MVPHNPSLFSLSIVFALLSSHSLLTVVQATTPTTQSAPVATPLPVEVNLGDARYKYVGCYNETTGFEEAGKVRALTGGTMVSRSILSPFDLSASPLSAHPNNRLVHSSPTT